MNTTTANTPRIYVASLADYNAGRLHGRWINADQPADAIHAEIALMLSESKEPFAEEWAVHDYEHFGPLRLSEYGDIDDIAQTAALTAEHGELFAHLLARLGGFNQLEEAKAAMEEGYRGEFDSLAEYAAQLAEECCGDALKTLPDFIRWHIDYEGVAREMELSGDLFTVEVDRRVHVFESRF